MSRPCYEVIVIGASFGGVAALSGLLPGLSKITDLPIVVVQHTKASVGNSFADQLDLLCCAKVKEAQERECLQKGVIYIAPGDYHLLIDIDGVLQLPKDNPVQYARPSIDVLFESAVDAYGEAVIGVLLTGANEDGVAGIVAIHQAGGLTIVQDPKEAEIAIMPAAAIKTGKVDYISSLSDIPTFIGEKLDGGGS